MMGIRCRRTAGPSTYWVAGRWGKWRGRWRSDAATIRYAGDTSTRRSKVRAFCTRIDRAIENHQTMIRRSGAGRVEVDARPAARSVRSMRACLWRRTERYGPRLLVRSGPRMRRARCNPNLAGAFQWMRGAAHPLRTRGDSRARRACRRRGARLPCGASLRPSATGPRRRVGRAAPVRRRSGRGARAQVTAGSSRSWCRCGSSSRPCGARRGTRRAGISGRG